MQTRLLITLAVLLPLATAAADSALNGDAAQCFAETERAIQGVEPESLSTAACRRALRFEMIGRADRSAMLHNRGLIEQAKGDLEAARTSFARAVRLSTTVDKRNLALAQAAQQLGEYELAIEQYELLKDSELAKDAQTYSSIVHNLAVATAAAGQSVAAAEAR